MGALSTNRNMVAKVAGAAVGMAMISMLVVGSFLGALHSPAPHNLPVAVVGPAVAVSHVKGALSTHAPGMFELYNYDNELASRQAVLQRSVDAAIILRPGHSTLLVASAAGRFTSQAVTSAFQELAATTGQHLVVQDILPLSAGDPNGISQLFLTIALALGGIGFSIALTLLANDQLDALGQLASLALFAALTSLVATWVADGMVGALVGTPIALFAICALSAFAIATTCAAGARLLGLPFVGLLALLVVAIGIPAGGGPFGTAFVSSWYGHLGSALPTGAAMTAIRNVVYFRGHALGGPLLVLSLWSVIPAGVLFIPPLRVIAKRHATQSRTLAKTGT